LLTEGGKDGQPTESKAEKRGEMARTRAKESRGEEGKKNDGFSFG